MAANALERVFRHLRTLAAVEQCRDLSDSDLLERFIAEDDEAAFTLLVQRHGGMVLHVCRRVLHDAHLAEEAFQATFVVLGRQASSIRKRRSLASWLHGVALKVALKARQRAATRRHRETEAGAMRRSETIDDATWEELRGILDEELAALPEKPRAAVILHYLEGKTHAQAAGELGCAKSTLQSYLERGRERLRERLTQRGLTLSAAAVAAALTEQAAAVPTVQTLSALRAVMTGTILIWPAPQLSRHAERPGNRELEQWWIDLASEDARRAYAALVGLSEEPQATVLLFRERLRPVAEASAERIRHLVAELDNREFTIREEAKKQLGALEDQAASALRMTLKSNLSLQQRRYVEQLLAGLEGIRTPQSLRQVRALEILERLDTPEAKLLLQKLAQGAPEARLTQEAKASLERQAIRHALKP